MKTPAEHMVDSFYAHMGANSGSKPMAAAMRAALNDTFGTKEALEAGAVARWGQGGTMLRRTLRGTLRAAGVLADG